MFYSHQLLSRKAPLGQIWIAATMHAKINRRKAEQIDIAEICEQILNPVVPLALRLSGILMGGVVRIYDRKVTIFSEDANNLLIQIKLVTATKDVDTTSLRKEKTQARFDAITIEYAFDDEYSQIEKVMLQNVDDNETVQGDKFFFLSNSVTPIKEWKPKHMEIEAEQENITIQEDLLHAEDVAGNDRIPPPNDVIIEDLCPELQFQDDPLLELNINMGPEVQEDTMPTANKKEAFPERAPQQQKTRPRRRAKRKTVLDVDFTEIPAQIFNTWLKDPSDIKKDTLRTPKFCVPHEAVVDKQFSFPSTSLCWSPNTGLESTWAPSLLQLWRMNLPKRQRTQSSQTNSSESLKPVRRQMMKQAEEHDDIIQNQSLQEAGLEDVEELRHDMEIPKYKDYGSIEKLRSALNTPNMKGRDEFLINQLGLTPALSGQSGKSRTSQRIGTPNSGHLSLENETEFPRMPRTRRSQSMEGFSPGLELLPDEYLREAVAPDYALLGDAGLLGGTLSQFELQETGPSQEPLNTKLQPINNATSSILRYLQEQYSKQQEDYISMDALTYGLDRTQAAKLFYHICVMASSQFLRVEQQEPYANIILYKGAYF